MKIILFGSMGNIGQVAFQALQNAGIECLLVSFPQNLHRDFPGYRRELFKAVSTFKPDAVIPIGHPLSMAMLKDELSNLGIEAIVESKEKIRLLDSKVSFSALISELGVSQPEIFASEQAALASGRALVFKRDVSFAGHGVHMPKSAESLHNLIEHQSPGESYLIEEYIEGWDASVDAVRLKDGRFLAQSYISITKAKSALTPSIEREIIGMPELTDIARSIMEYIDYQGVCGFDFRISESDGKAYILEANPRFTAGLETHLSTGFNLPLLLTKML